MADEKHQDGLPTEPPPSYESAAQTSTPVVAAGTNRAPLPHPRTPLPLELPTLTALRKQRVILASASPRRKQLLAH
ncbi:MAG: hypothetical protein M1816_003503, partial [Peltula sp. TS41687]